MIYIWLGHINRKKVPIEPVTMEKLKKKKKKIEEYQSRKPEAVPE